MPSSVRWESSSQEEILAELLDDDAPPTTGTWSVRCTRTGLVRGTGKVCPASEEWIIFDPAELVSRAREAFANRRAGEAVTCRFPMQGESS